MKLREIDPVEAIRLYDEGRSWAEVGRILAERRSRRSPFWGATVLRVVNAYRRATSAGEAAIPPVRKSG